MLKKAKAKVTDKNPKTKKTSKNNDIKKDENEYENNDDDLDDAEYFKQEVGQEPEPGLYYITSRAILSYYFLILWLQYK